MTGRYTPTKKKKSLHTSRQSILRFHPYSGWWTTRSQFNILFHFKTKSFCSNTGLYTVLTNVFHALPPAIESTMQRMQLSGGALAMVWTQTAHQPVTCHQRRLDRDRAGLQPDRAPGGSTQQHRGSALAASSCPRTAQSLAVSLTLGFGDKLSVPLTEGGMHDLPVGTAGTHSQNQNIN